MLLSGGLVFAAVASSQSPETRLETVVAAHALRVAETLAASEMPRERWIGGLLLASEAMGGDDPAQASAREARAYQLLESSLIEGGDDATLLFWAVLDPPLRDRSNGDAMARERMRLIERLQALEPDNAVVWLATMPPPEAPNALPEALAALRKAASAPRFDTHFAASMQMLLAAIEKVPPPDNWPDTRGIPGWDGIAGEDLATIMAVGIAAGLSMPYLLQVSRWCRVDAHDTLWRDDCRKLGKHMAEDSDSIVPVSLGLALLGRLYAESGPEGRLVRERRRQLAWWMEQGLQQVGPGRAVSYRAWRKAWAAEGADELSVARALLAEQGLPPDPPAGFVPGWERAQPGSVRKD